MKSATNFLVSLCVGFTFAISASARTGEICPILFQSRGVEILAALGQNTLIEQYSIYRKNIIYSLLNNLKLFFGIEYDKNAKVFDIVKKNNLFEFHDEAQIEKLSGELMLALYGHKRVFDDYFSKDEDQRKKEIVLRNVNESLLRKGLMATWKSLGYKPSPTSWARTKLTIYKFATNRFFSRFQQFPFFSAAEIKISDALIGKIILDGYEAHVNEVGIELKNQKWHEDYNMFARIARVTLLWGVLLTQYAVAVGEDSVKEINQQATKQFVLNQYQSIQIQTHSMTQEKLEIIEEAYQSARQDFVQKRGAEPTPLESEELRAKVINGIFSGEDGEN